MGRGLQSTEEGNPSSVHVELEPRHSHRERKEDGLVGLRGRVPVELRKRLPVWGVH